MTKSRGILPARRFWQPWELEALRRFYPDWRSDWLAKAIGRDLQAVYRKAKALGIGKSAAYLASPDACRLRQGDNVGAATRFKPGQTPWSKGKKVGTRGRAGETQFKAGARPHTYLPVGTLNTDSAGYPKVKLRDPNVWGYLAQLVWASTHDWPPPKGMVIRYVDGDRANCHPDNLVLGDRRELMAANTIQNYPEPIKQLVRARASLVRKINDHEQNRRRTRRAVRADEAPGRGDGPGLRDRAIKGDG